MDIKSLQFCLLAKQQIPLVNQFYKQVYKKGLANKNDQVFVLKTTDIICAARIKLVHGHHLLTGVACAQARRKQGFASLLLNYLLSQQKGTIYCFPYPHLQGFYEQQGFQLITADLLPVALREQYQRYNSRKPLLCMMIKSRLKSTIAPIETE